MLRLSLTLSNLRQRLRRRIIALCYAVICYLEDPTDWTVEEGRARILIEKAETIASKFKGVNGDWKRWAFVSSRLRREFPDLSRRHINQIIERVVDERAKRANGRYPQ